MDSIATFRHAEPGDHPPAGAGLSRGLGLFGLGLGLVELAAPRAVARAIGVDPEGRTALALRTLGLREVVSGLAILLSPRRPLPLWARVTRRLAT